LAARAAFGKLLPVLFMWKSKPNGFGYELKLILGNLRHHFPATDSAFACRFRAIPEHDSSVLATVDTDFRGWWTIFSQPMLGKPTRVSNVEPQVAAQTIGTFHAVGSEPDTAEAGTFHFNEFTLNHLWNRATTDFEFFHDQGELCSITWRQDHFLGGGAFGRKDCQLTGQVIGYRQPVAG
jgi:hypothetical protein